VPYTQILSEKRDHVALLTLNRPEKLNAWTPTMHLELVQAVEEANADPTIGAIVVTGSGRGFCAGADISGNFAKRLDEAPSDSPTDAADEVGPDWVDVVRAAKPMIAAINGVAVGVGITLALPFDVILMGASSRVGMFFVKMGLVPELCSSNLLVQRVGFARASEMCLTGRLYSAQDLDGTGFANEVVDDDRLLERALELAREIAANPDSSLRMIKQLLTQNGSCGDLAVVRQREHEALQRAYATPEHREAVQAFIEKRPPSFR